MIILSIPPEKQTNKTKSKQANKQKTYYFTSCFPTSSTSPLISETRRS